MTNWKNYDVDGQMNLFDLGIWSGKTSQEHSVQTVERTFASSLKKPRESQTKQPLFLNLRGGGGLMPDVSWETDGAWLGELQITNFGEHPNVDVESRLSQILTAGVPQKYYLSATACQGILRRAERRGKELPKLLKDTLMRQAATPSKLGGGAEFDRYGKRAGKGALIQTELSGTLGVSQDQTLITLEGNGSRDSHRGDGYKESDTMYTLNTVEQHAVCMNPWDVQSKHIQPENGVAEALYSGERRYGGGESYVAYGISAYESNAMKSSNPYSGVYEARTSRTLDLNGGSPACNQGGMAIVQNVKQTSYQKTTGTLSPGAHVGGYNGQDAYNDMLIVDEVYGLDRASFNQGKNAQYDFSVEKDLAQTIVSRGPGGGISPTVGALCARDYKGVGNQYVGEGKCIIDHL